MPTRYQLAELRLINVLYNLHSPECLQGLRQSLSKNRVSALDLLGALRILSTVASSCLPSLDVRLNQSFLMVYCTLGTRRQHIYSPVSTSDEEQWGIGTAHDLEFIRSLDGKVK